MKSPVSKGWVCECAFCFLFLMDGGWGLRWRIKRMGLDRQEATWGGYEEVEWRFGGLAWMAGMDG